MSRKRLTRNALSGIFQVLATGAITFELYRFLNRHLTVAQIGTWSVVLASAATGRLIDLGLGGGVVKFVAKHIGEDARSQAAATIQMALLGMALLFGFVSVVLFPLLHAGLALLIKDYSTLDEARALLPYALVTLILGALSGVTLSALDGCQRMDLRALVGIAGSAVQLVSAYCLVPAFGLLGMAIAQVVQSAVVLTCGTLLLTRLIGPDLYGVAGWRMSTFKELIRYGSGFQMAAFGQLLFDPAIKAILTLYSGLEFTGYYEMANRLIMQLRSIPVSAYQSLVPYVASASKSGEELRAIYVSSYRLLFFFSALCFGMFGLLLPYILQIWLGRFVPKFIEIGELCLLGWAINTLNVPAYYMFLGIGQLRWPVVTQSAIGISAAGMGILFGRFFGGFGVLSAVAMALMFGSHIVSHAFLIRHHIPLSALVPVESRPAFVCAVAGPPCVLWLTLSSGTELSWRTLPVVVGFAAALIAFSLKNPNTRVLLKLFHELRTGWRKGAANPA